MNKIQEHTVPELEKPTRLSEFIPLVFTSFTSKKSIKKAIKNGTIKVNGEITAIDSLVKGGELIELFNSDVENKKELDFDLEILYEDDYLAIINKPAGIVVSGNKFRTIENALPGNLKISPQKSALSKPQAIHRLDYPTSGVLLIGKTKEAVIQLNKLFENKEIQKTYHAITIGKMQKKGSIDIPIEGKNSYTEFEILKSVTSEKFEQLNLVKLIPSTGRRHQLRIHLSSLGNPILGDKQYGKEGLILHGKGLFLHASSLAFVHPFTGENIFIEKELPKKFMRLFGSNHSK